MSDAGSDEVHDTQYAFPASESAPAATDRYLSRDGAAEVKYANGDSFTGTFAGGLKDGPSNTYKYANGAEYTGPYSKGIREGKGRQVYPDHSSYEGEFSQGERHGMGTYKYASGESYTGQWEHGRKSGQGTFKWAKSVADASSESSVAGLFCAGDLVQGEQQAAGSIKYRGAFKNGKPQGKDGSYTMPDGRVIRGEYDDIAAAAQSIWKKSDTKHASLDDVKPFTNKDDDEVVSVPRAPTPQMIIGRVCARAVAITDSQSLVDNKEKNTKSKEPAAEDANDSDNKAASSSEAQDEEAEWHQAKASVFRNLKFIKALVDEPAAAADSKSKKGKNAKKTSEDEDTENEEDAETDEEMTEVAKEISKPEPCSVFVGELSQASALDKAIETVAYGARSADQEDEKAPQFAKLTMLLSDTHVATFVGDSLNLAFESRHLERPISSALPREVPAADRDDAWARELSSRVEKNNSVHRFLTFDHKSHRAHKSMVREPTKEIRTLARYMSELRETHPDIDFDLVRVSVQPELAPETVNNLMSLVAQCLQASLPDDALGNALLIASTRHHEMDASVISTAILLIKRGYDPKLTAEHPLKASKDSTSHGVLAATAPVAELFSFLAAGGQVASEVDELMTLCASEPDHHNDLHQHLLELQQQFKSAHDSRDEDKMRHLTSDARTLIQQYATLVLLAAFIKEQVELKASKAADQEKVKAQAKAARQAKVDAARKAKAQAKAARKAEAEANEEEYVSETESESASAVESEAEEEPVQGDAEELSASDQFNSKFGFGLTFGAWLRQPAQLKAEALVRSRDQGPIGAWSFAKA